MSIFGGPYHVVYMSDGKVYGFGSNSRYQLRDPEKDKDKDKDDDSSGSDHVHVEQGVSVPVEIKIPGYSRVVKFRNGGASSTTVVLTTAGLYGRGDGSYGLFSDGKHEYKQRMKVIEFYKNKEVENYWCEGGALWVLVAKGKILRGGCNVNGELGNGTRLDIRVPEELDTSFLCHAEEKVVDIATSSHTLLLTDHGKVYATGEGKSGRRGMGIADFGVKSTFGVLPLFAKICDAAKISTGGLHSLFVTTLGFCFSCGDGENGQNGHNDDAKRFQPAIIRSLKRVKVKKICAGAEFSLFLTTKCVVYGCGKNDSFQQGFSNPADVLVPSKLAMSFRIVDVAVTYTSTCLVTSTGDVYSVGENDEGQCAVGNTDSVVSSFTKAKFRITLGTKSLFKEQPHKLFDVLIFVYE